MNVSKWKLWLLPMVAAQIGLLLLAASAIGQPDLGPEEIVQAGGSDLTVSGYSVPSYVDWDDDGLPDLIVGEGTSIGKVRVYLNTGSVSSPSFSTYSYAQSGSSDLTVTGGG